MIGETINTSATFESGSTAVLAGRYRVLHQLGQGGMGSVWLAEDIKLDGRKVAIKMLPSVLVANKRAYRQVKAEALVSLKLSHPNIATLRSFEEENGTPFLVVDYIDGQTLDDYLGEHGTMTENEVIVMLSPIATALDYAHKERVVHRDVKPANIMIRKDGTPFILDFGIAREMQETMTRVTGKLSSGTLMYMSPEQLKGAAPSPSQDIYSFAALLYECLTDHPPFYRGQIEYQIETQQPESLSEDISVGELIMAGLEKMPEKRPTTCLALLNGRQQVGLEVIQPSVSENAPLDDANNAESSHATAKAVDDFQLEMLRTQISNKKIAVEGLVSKVESARADALGLTEHLRRIDANLKIVNQDTSRLDVDSAKLLLATVSESVDVIKNEVEWLEANIPLRNDCRQYFTSVLSKYEQPLKDYWEELSRIEEHEAGNRYWKEAADLFDAGDFVKAKAKWERMSAAFSSALTQARKARVDGLIQEARRLSQSYDWDRCLETLAKVLALDPQCDAAMRLKSIAEDGKTIKPGSRRVVNLGNDVRMEFAYCPPGTFVMGSPTSEPERSDDEVLHRVNISAGFWIGVSPVTKAQWREIMGGISQVKIEDGTLGFCDDDHPRTSVSWKDAKRFIKEATLKCHIQFGLPTETQWEYACRAGTTTPYNFGASLCGDKANCNGRYPYGTTKQGPYKAATTKVNSYAANAWGLLDFHGNVSEWCEDWYGPYPTQSTDPMGPEQGTLKVVRGGNWLQKAKECRSASRGKQPPSQRALNGFRLVVKDWH